MMPSELLVERQEGDLVCKNHCFKTPWNSG